MGVQYEKFSTQVDAAKLVRLRAIADREGRQLRAVLDDALAHYLKMQDTPQGLSPELQGIYDEFVEQFDATLTKLAK